VRRSDSFAFETTLSGLIYAQKIEQWRAVGYHISLFFLALPNAETAIARVAERVRQGGHAIPEAVIRRRFVAGLNNFDPHDRHRVHTWAKYDNTEDQPVLLEWGEH
jgi:predicted ABC-type ATPase